MTNDKKTRKPRGRPRKDGQSYDLTTDSRSKGGTDMSLARKQVFNKKTRRMQVPDETLLAYRYQGHSHNEISRLTGLSRSTIQTRLSKLAPEVQSIEEFRKKGRLDMLSVKQRQMLEAITPDKLEAASAKDLSISFGVMYDKSRLEEVKSTANVSYAQLIAARKQKEAELAHLLEIGPEGYAQELAEQEKRIKLNFNIRSETK